MQRSTFFLAAMVIVAAVLIVMDRPETAPPVAPASAPAAAGAAGALPEGHPPLSPGAPTGASAGPLATVLESMESGGYTYARVETEGEEIWVAGPPTELEIGSEVTLGGAMGMENFTAASLGRTFDRILFVNGFGGAASAGAQARPMAPAQTGAGAGTGVVREVSNAAGYSYLRVETDDGEIWLAGTQLEVSEGQTVSWQGGAMMQNFDSPSLGRVFDEILFADGLRPGG